MSRLTVTLLLAMVLLVAGVNAQTVTVATSGTPDFATIQAAIDSFDPDPDAGQANVIHITDSASYEEVINVDVPVTIEGTATDRPVVLCLPNTGGDGIRVSVPTGTFNDVTLRNLIVLPSLTSTPGGDGIRSLGQNLNLLLENILVTANDGSNQPVTTTGLASVDLTSATVWGDDGVFLGATASPAGDGTVVTLVDTVLTHNNNGGNNDGAVLSSSGTAYNIREGCVFSYNARLGIQANRAFTIDAPTNPVVVKGNQGFAGIWFASGDSRSINGLICVDNAVTGVEHQNGGGVPFGLSNAIIANNGGNGLVLGEAATTGLITISDVTIFGNTGSAIFGTDFTAPVFNVEISDSVIAGNGTAASPENAIDIRNVASAIDIENSAVVTAGAFALNGAGSTAGIGVSNEAIVTTSNVINADPAFFTTTLGERNFAAPTAAAYDTANDGGTYLNGGFIVNRSAATASVDGTDVALGDAVAIQNVQTQFGNVTDADPINGGGSELDALYISNDPTHLLIGIAGNLEPSGNNITVLIDTDPLASPGNGVTVLPGTIDNTADATRGFSGMNGDTLPFPADFAFVLENGGFGPSANLITMTSPSTVSGEDLGKGGFAVAASGLVDYSTSSSFDIQAGLNNSNIAGVAGGDHYHGAGAADPEAVTTGYEIAIPLSDLGLSEGDVIQVVAYVASFSGFVSNQALPALSPPTGNLGGNGSGQDLPAQGMNRVASYEVGAGQTPVSNFQLYR